MIIIDSSEMFVNLRQQLLTDYRQYVSSVTILDKYYKARIEWVSLSITFQDLYKETLFRLKYSEYIK